MSESPDSPQPAAPTPDYRITWLSAHRDLVPTLAAWHYDAFRHYVPNWSVAAAAAELATHRLHDLPCSLVAISEEGEALGSVRGIRIQISDTVEDKKAEATVSESPVNPRHR